MGCSFYPDMEKLFGIFKLCIYGPNQLSDTIQFLLFANKINDV